MNQGPSTLPKSSLETVFTVTDYWDGPRQGIANFQGKPHFYDCVFDEQENGYSNFFRLTPIDEEAFRLAMEDWAIWRRWYLAFHSGQTDISSHPALPEDAERHRQLKEILEKKLVTDQAKAETRIGRFTVPQDPELEPGIRRPMQVEWLEVDA